MGTYQNPHKTKAPQSLQDSTLHHLAPQSSEIPSPIQPPSMQTKSNEEGLAEWEAQRQKWARLGSPWVDKVPNPSGDLAKPWITPFPP